MKGHGDDIERILAERHWLRRLSASLARTEADAEDLAQGSMAAALSGPVPPLRSPRAWLGQIARNMAARSAVQERARRARERESSRAEATESAARSVANMETFGLLSGLVLELDEPCRTAITLRYERGMTPTRIARELGVPASTVRSRLARGLAQLRVALEQRDPEGRWLSALSPAVLASDGTRRAAAAAAIVLVCGLGVVGAKLLGRGGGDRGPGPVITRLDDDAEAREDATAELDPAAEPQSARTHAAPSPPTAEPTATAADEPAPAAPVAPPPGTIEVLVTVGGEPLTQGEVLLAVDQAVADVRPTPGLRLGGTVPARQRSLGSSGRVRFDGLTPGDWKVAVCLREDHSAQVTVTLPEGAGRTVEVALFDNAIAGHAWDERGAPIANAWVTLSRSRHDPRGQLTRTDLNGAYRMEFVWPGESFIGLHPDTETPDHRNDVGPMEKVRVPAEGELIHDFGSPRGTAEITARLVTRGGERPVLSRAIDLRCDEVEGDGYHGGHLSEDSNYAAKLRMGEGAWRFGIDHPLEPGKRLPIAEVEVGFDDEEVELVLPGTRVVVELQGVTSENRTGLRVTRAGKDWPLWHGALTVDGRWIIDGVLPGEWDLRASDGTGATAGPVRIQVIEQDIELAATLVLAH